MQGVGILKKPQRNKRAWSKDKGEDSECSGSLSWSEEELPKKKRADRSALWFLIDRHIGTQAVLWDKHWIREL